MSKSMPLKSVIFHSETFVRTFEPDDPTCADVSPPLSY